MALRHRAACGGMFLATWAIGYFGTAAREVVRFDPTMPLDIGIPFVGIATWLYLAGIAWIALPWGAVRASRTFERFAIGAFVALAIAIACFAVLPTGAPALRVQASIEGLEWVTARLLAFLHRIDAPANQLPSLHVALSWLASFAIARQFPRWRAAAWAVGVLVIASVLLAKQHALCDVAAGLLLAWTSDRVGARLTR